MDIANCGESEGKEAKRFCQSKKKNVIAKQLILDDLTFQLSCWRQFTLDNIDS